MVATATTLSWTNRTIQLLTDPTHLFQGRPKKVEDGSGRASCRNRLNAPVLQIHVAPFCWHWFWLLVSNPVQRQLK